MMKRPCFSRQCPYRYIAGAVLLLFLSCTCFAQSPANTVTATPSNPNTLTAVSGSTATYQAGGLNVTVQSRWLDGTGYRPIGIGISPIAAVSADRELIARVSVHQFWNPNDRIVLCEQFISIPAGTQPGQIITTMMSVPPMHMYSNFSIEIIDPTLTPSTVFQQMQVKGQNISSMEPNISTVLYSYPRILFMDYYEPPETGAITDCLTQIKGQVLNDPETGQAPSKQDNITLPTAIAFPMGELPERWIDYSSLDVVCLSVEQLAALAKGRPSTHKAILQWVNSGGNLWIWGLSGANGRWKRLPKLEQSLGLPVTDPEKIDDANINGWTRPSNETFGSKGQDYVNQPAQTTYDGQGIPYINQQQVKKPLPKPPPVPKESSFLIREYGMGTVAAIASDDPFSGKDTWSKWEWDWLLNTTGAGRWQWSARHGMNVGETNGDFWSFLIPGVGLAPVLTFQILITLFILSVGPANYWLLKRRQKLHLIVLTVPVSAMAVTAALFGYAIISDGLGTRLRVRSITRLDQRRGTAVTWARLSYYAGLTPSKGLTFSPNTAVYPISDKGDYEDYKPQQKNMIWEDDQRLVQGWLNSRTPTQYLTVRSGPSARRLEIAAPADSTDELEIENRLGVFVFGLAIRGQNDKYYWTDNLGVGAKARAKPATLEKIHSWLAKANAENQPAFPPGLDQRDLYNGRRSRYYYYFNRSTNQVSFPDSQLEQMMEWLAGNVHTRGGIMQSFRSGSPPIAPGSYVALVAKSPDLELGTHSAVEEASFHIILGEW
jgi:hypothetical protein